MKIVLSPNPYRDKGLRWALKAREVLTAAGAEICITFPFDLEGDKVELPAGLTTVSPQEAYRGAEVLVCFGGDGTILHAAKAAERHHIPVLGVNLGSVGFMAELEQDQLGELARLVKGDFRIEERMMLDVTVRRGDRTVFKDQALNDAVVTKGTVARIVEVEVRADDTLMGRFPGDGVIVATPTGSTAYSMSSGGPIIEPTAEAIAVTPICPHLLYAKSFVLGGGRTVTVAPDGRSGKTACLSVDGGRAFRLKPGDRVEIRRSRSKARLVRLTGRSFYTLMNQKLGRTEP